MREVPKRADWVSEVCAALDRIGGLGTQRVACVRAEDGQPVQIAVTHMEWRTNSTPEQRRALVMAREREARESLTLGGRNAA